MRRLGVAIAKAAESDEPGCCGSIGVANICGVASVVCQSEAEAQLSVIFLSPQCRKNMSEKTPTENTSIFLQTNLVIAYSLNILKH